MKASTASRLKIIVAGSFILVVAGLLVLVAFGFFSRSSPLTSAVPFRDSSRLQASGFVYSFPLSEGRRCTVSVEELTHRNRKMGPLTINVFREVLMKDVRIEVSLKGDSGSPAEVPFPPPLEESVERVLGEEKLNRMTRLEIDGLEYIATRDGATLVALSVGQVIADAGRDEVRLAGGLSLITIGGHTLFAPSGSWSIQGKTLTVDFPHLSHGETPIPTGRKSVLRLDPRELTLREETGP